MTMITYRNIFLTVSFMTFVGEIVNTGVTREDQECADQLLIDFGWDLGRQYNKRILLPKEAFKNRLYNMFAKEGERQPNIAQRLFIHFHDLLQAKDGTLILIPWCQRRLKVSGFTGDEYEFISDCFMKLHIFFKDSNHATEILKDAYSNLVASRFTGPNEQEARIYFNYLLNSLEPLDGADFMTPTEFCQGKTAAEPKYIKKRNTPESKVKFSSSSSKTQKI